MEKAYVLIPGKGVRWAKCIPLLLHPHYIATHLPRARGNPPPPQGR